MAGCFARRQVAPVAQIGEESQAARACFAGRVWRRRCDIWTCYPKAIPASVSPPVPCRTVDGGGGADTAAQQQYRMLLMIGSQMMVSDWSHHYLRSLNKNSRQNNKRERSFCVQITNTPTTQRTQISPRPAMPRFKVSAFWLLILAWIFCWYGSGGKARRGRCMKNSAQTTGEPLAGNGGMGDYRPGWLTVRVMKRLQQLEKMQKQRARRPLIRSVWS